MEQESLSPDEIKALKELAKNLMAMSRSKRILTTGILWLAGVVAALVLLWDNIGSHIQWK